MGVTVLCWRRRAWYAPTPDGTAPLVTQPDVLNESPRARYQRERARAIQYYKEIISHERLMRIGALASERILAHAQFVLDGQTLADEVDALIAARVEFPRYRSWVRARYPRGVSDHASFPASVQLVLDHGDAERSGTEPVLTLQPHAVDAWEALCSAGRAVIVVEPDAAERGVVVSRAGRRGWRDLVRADPFTVSWPSSDALSAVLYSPAAMADLSRGESEHLVASLKRATVRGGVHVVDGLMLEREWLPRSFLRRSYEGWRLRARRTDASWTLVAECPRSEAVRE